MSERQEKKVETKDSIYLLMVLILDYLPITSVISQEAREEVDISTRPV